MLETLLTSDSQRKVDDNRNEQEDAQHGRTETIVVRPSPPHSDGFGTPVVSDKGIYHGQHGNESEQAR